MSEPSEVQHFDEILHYLQQSRGFDFTAYKRSSLTRRVTRRMQVLNIPTFEEYFDYLQVHQDEFDQLFNTILINVTAFFRDEDVWQYLQSTALPQMLAERKADVPFRVWIAGCASGQEAYTVLIVLCELMGADAVRDQVKIYATDVDQQALAEARQATYTPKQLEGVPAALVDKYFDRTAVNYSIRRDLRRAVIFGRHDLIQDAPISKVDFLLCRNTLMYFNADAQSRILARFFFSLNPGAYILLGRAEMLFSHVNMFTPVDLKRRLFKAVPKPNHRDRLLLLAQTGREIVPTYMTNQARLRDAAFETNGAAQVVFDVSGMLVGVNALARQHLNLSSKDVGRPLQELELSFRPLELRGHIESAIREREDVLIKNVSSSQGSETRTYDVSVTPLVDEENTVIGTRVMYDDVTELRTLQTQLQHSKQELETAYEELQSTNEELETTNEELQSTVEELETTNEELQSTNEELETMNEELQSTNEELQTMNDELRNRSTDLNSANAFLESVFASLRSAVVVVDRDFQVQVWNDRSTDLWGLRPEEAQGQHFLGLDVGLPVGELRQSIRDVIGGTQEFKDVVLPATNRRGRAIQCRVTVGPLRQFDRSASGAILLMEELVVPQQVSQVSHE